jgi:PAS domain S-box-containing protein
MAILSLRLKVDPFRLEPMRFLLVFGLMASLMYSRKQVQAAKRESITRKIIQAVHSSLNLEEVFQQLANELGTYLQVDRCFIANYDKQAKELVPPTREYRSSAGISSMLGATDTLSRESSWLLDLMVQRKGPVMFDYNTPGFSKQGRTYLKSIQLQTGLGCPVLYNGHCLAILFVHQVKKKQYWSEEDKEVIQMTTNQAASAIYQAKLYQELQQAQRESESAKESYRLLVEGVRDYAIFMLSPEGRVVTWNTGAQRMIGYEAHEIMGQHFSRFFIKEDRKQRKPEQDLKIAASVEWHEEEGWRLRKDGSKFWANESITVLRNDQGELMGFCKIIRDITERKLIEQALSLHEEQQAVVAKLGLLALSGIELPELMSQAVTLLAKK